MLKRYISNMVPKLMKLRKNKEGNLESYMDPKDPKEAYSGEGAVPIEVPAGSIVLLHGNFLHFLVDSE